MTWNHRIVRYENGDLCLHEVYYNDDGVPYMRTDKPFIAVDSEEGKEGIRKTLLLMLSDVTSRPILEESEIKYNIMENEDKEGESIEWQEIQDSVGGPPVLEP